MKLLIIILLLPTALFSQNRYVSNGGSDAANGLTPGTAWQTMVKVRSAHQTGAQIHPGDTVFFNRGDVFTPQSGFNGCQIWGSPTGNAVSGTSGHPIVWDAYGTGDKPNFLFTLSRTTDTTSTRCLSFEGVDYYVIRNLRCVDTRRMPVSHILGAYCAGFIQFGERGSGQETDHCKAENCDTYGTGLGVIIVGSTDSVVNCRFEEMGNVDAIGQDSYGANCITLSGSHHYISGNYMADAWAWSDTFAPFFNGGAIEAFNDVDSCMFSYNTFVNCSGIVEFGATASGTQTCALDTFSYNKGLNNGDGCYVNVNGGFDIEPDRICWFNNDLVENDSSLFSGPNGGRLMHDFPNWPSGYEAVYRVFYNNGSPAASTIYVLKNNLIRNYNGFTVILTPGKTSHTYNGANLTGGSTWGTSFSTGEANVTNMWRDTSSGFVQNWDFHLKAQITGTSVGGTITHDFFNVTLVAPISQGVAQFITPPTNAIFLPGYIKVGGVVNHVDKFKN